MEMNRSIIKILSNPTKEINLPLKDNKPSKSHTNNKVKK
jgi:hypothetical protein